ncbi:hypothetical protein CHS0354_004293 [Potamilus streckersoni]|uniref:Uncharacterized protein n=1 Tax=Potamilus streckersoni TaxID=2493646 RepID=A0AAE0VNU7_9BIVA|nr:hypothetical protein CHS0354_004293 [Potamilus streckersoni]
MHMVQDHFIHNRLENKLLSEDGNNLVESMLRLKSKENENNWKRKKERRYIRHQQQKRNQQGGKVEEWKMDTSKVNPMARPASSHIIIVIISTLHGDNQTDLVMPSTSLRKEIPTRY